jgi:hypothetical protein
MARGGEGLDDSSQGSHDCGREDEHGHGHRHILTRVQHVWKHFHCSNVPIPHSRQQQMATDTSHSNRGERQR